MIHGSFVNCLMDVDRATEFSGDDAAQYSKLIDIGRVYEGLVIMNPGLSVAGTIQIFVQEDANSATVPLNLAGANSGTAYSFGTVTGAKCLFCNQLGGHRYLRLKTSVNQTSDITFRVMGVRS